MKDPIRECIDRHLDVYPQDDDGGIAEVVGRYSSAHAADYLASERQRRGTSTRQRRATSLTTLSSDAAILSVQSTLSESERLVIANDGRGLEVLEGVEEDEDVPGEVVVLRD